MKKIISSLTFIALSALLLLSCRKADTSNIVDNSYDGLMKANAAVQQTFTIDAATGGTITCKRGSKIVFPPNCFANPDNSTTTGTVKVLVKEALDKSQWLLEGLSTSTQTGMLISGGMLDIQAGRMADGVEVKPSAAMLVPTQSMVNVIKAEIPKIKNLPDTMALFVPGGPAPVNTATPPKAWAAAYYPFGNGVNSYIFQIPQFHWVNCDGLYSQPGAKTTVKVTPDLSGVTGATGVQVILLYKNISTVITLPAAGNYMQSYANSIPVGSTVDVVCIGKDGAGNIIFKFLPSTVITASMDISIKPVVTDAATVTAYLNSIN